MNLLLVLLESNRHTRFWQVEPLADLFVGINVYQFGYNNPVSYNDPSGLSPNDIPGECTHCGLIGGFHNPHDPSTSTSNFGLWMWFSGNGERTLNITGSGFSSGSFRSPTADRMVLLSGRNQRASNVVYSVGDGIGIVLYDLDGSFISGDITNNSAIVAVKNEKGEGKSEWDFLTSGGDFITQEELLDRATWVIGEAGGSSSLLTYRKYAHSIENSIKVDPHGTGKPSSTFENMREILMKDKGWLTNEEGALVDSDGNYAMNGNDLVPVDKNNNVVDKSNQAQSVKISMAQYRMRTFDTRLFTATRTSPNLRTSNQVRACSSLDT
ncbi:hypothetical protein V9L05_01590 [Bernardetia sp. Wsw4-3y2]|uniref:hypothetical protein n=1 Tax=Bernardetia sp. Wsw4-3y2 TaxID=3127471 RepID=UPI0030D0B82C